MRETEIAVIGAGPAGLSAALHTSLAGARVTVIDEYARPGGQYFKQPPAAFRVRDRSLLGRGHDAGEELVRRVEAGQVEILPGTLVWAAFEPGVLELYQGGECRRLRAERTVVATGAYDRPIAFPGWTLPGVITAGAAQSLVKSQLLLPGERVLLAGSGPFLLPVAAQLAKGGATVAGVLEALSFGSYLGQGTMAWRYPEKLREAADYWTTLRRAKVPRLYGWTVIEARGKDQVEKAVIARVDRDWRPIPDTERTLQVDTVAVGFGFIPSMQLPRLLGCATTFDPLLGTWVTESDTDQRTTAPGVFVAGETTGIGGHEVAMEEGAIAGTIAAADLGKIPAADAERRLGQVRRSLARHRRFAAFLNRTHAIRPGLYDLVREDTTICRCEEVTAGEIAAAAKEWDGGLRTIKQVTRVGMGPCQGRICGLLAAQVAARATGKTVMEIGYDTPRPPVKPIPLGALATMEL